MSAVQSDDVALRAQLSKRTRLAVGEASFEYTIVSPRAPVDAAPILFAPGFAETIDSIQDIILALASEGRIITAFHSLRRTTDYVGMVPLSPVAGAVLAVIERLESPIVDAVAESAGAAAVLEAASQFPERFRSVILLNPAGFQGGEELKPVAERFHAHVLRTAEDALRRPDARARLQRYLWEGSVWLARNPRDAMEDAVAISRMDLRPLLERAREAGVRIAILQGQDDLLMPASGPERTLTGKDAASLITVPGGHAMCHADPTHFARMLTQLFATLANV